jgi:hypothetical protein
MSDVIPYSYRCIQQGSSCECCALTTIGEDALKAKQSDVATNVFASLTQISQEQKDPAVSAQIHASFQKLAKQAEQSALPDKARIANSLSVAAAR